MPATALCLSDHGSRIGGACRALYICPGGSVRDAQYAAGHVGLIVWLLLVSAAHAEKRIALLIGNQT
jgi:hypothetical protein